MKTGVLCVAVLTMLAVQQASAAFRSSCFGRCGFRSSNQGHQNYQQRFSPTNHQSRFPNTRYPSRFGPSQSQFGSGLNRFGSPPNRYGPSQGQFGSSQSQFGSSQSRFGTRPSQFGTASSHFSSRPSQFGTASSHFSSRPSQFGTASSHFSSSRFGQAPRRTSFQSRFASTTPEQRYQAHLATQRQLGQRRRQEQHLLQTRTGLVQPGTPSAALASEKRADSKSLALGNQALQQILYLQNLVGAGRRR